MDWSGEQENIFQVRQCHVDKWHKNHSPDTCKFCLGKIEIGHLCHSKLSNGKYVKRHVPCAIKCGVLVMTKHDHAIFALGLKKEQELFRQMELKKLEAEQLRQQVLNFEKPSLTVLGK